MAGCCNLSARVVLMLLAFVFWCCAAGMIFLTVHIFDFVGPIQHTFDVYYLTGPAGVLIGLSILLIALGFIGCLAACKDSRCLHMTFFTLLLLIVMMEITGAVLAIVYKEEVNKAIETGMNSAIDNYSNDSSSNVNESWDYMQETLHCCGVQNSTDWEKTPWGLANPKQVPDSCCKDPSVEGCGKNTTKENINIEGCHKVLYKDVKKYLAWIIAVPIIFALIQIFGLICTCVRIGNRKKGSSPYEVLGDDGKPEPISRGYPA